MKLLIAFIILSMGLGMTLMFMGSCNNSNNNHKQGHEKSSIQIRTVTPFSKIYIEGVFPVELSQDTGGEFVKVEAEADLQERIEVRNEGSKLLITMGDDNNINTSKRIKVYINIKKIDKLEFKSVGALTTAGQLKLDSLEVNSESVGKLELDVEADFLRTNLNSVGATILKGKVREARINNKSVGTLEAYDLKATTLMIHNTAIGSAEVYADSAFYIRSSAVGILHYKGPGVVKEMDVTGVGKVKKVE